ncbi:MAG: phage tail tape measure protein [Desulfovibrio sp.]
MAQQLHALKFGLSMVDRISGPVNRVKSNILDLASQSQKAFYQMGAGAMGAAGAGMALMGMVGPARDMNKALGELNTLDVSADTLKIVQGQAMEFAGQYGDNASDIVRSSYDIQSSISGLTGYELGRFTVSSATLAKATKADAATITDYMGTMYGIFEADAEKMGKSKWVEVLTGRTATAVQMFKTTGTQMAGAFSAIGANATAAGIAQSEQMAILGQLQSTMSGSEAGTKYKAFLAGVGNAQKQLGLQFTDSEGNMLGMVSILDKLKGKFGDSLNVDESNALKKAFGSDEAVSLVNQLMLNTDGLASNIDKLSKVNGMDKANSMAAARVDQIDRMMSGFTNMNTIFGQAILKGLNPFFSSIADGMGTVSQWMQKYENLTRWIGYGTVAILGMVAAVGIFTTVVAIARVASIGFGTTLNILRGGLVLLRNVQLLANAAMWASPILIIAGFMGILSIYVLDLFGGWEKMKASFMDSSWGKVIMGTLGTVLDMFSKVGDGIGWVADKLDIFSDDDSPTQAAAKSYQRSQITRGQSGVGSALAAVSEPVKIAPSKMLMASRTPNAPAGSVTSSIEKSKVFNNGNTSATHIENVNITTEKVDEQTFNEGALLGA